MKSLKPETPKKTVEKETEQENPEEAPLIVAEPKRKILPNRSSMGSLLKEVNEHIAAKKPDENRMELTPESLPELWKTFLEHIRVKAQTSFMSVAEKQQPTLEEHLIVFTESNNISLELLQLHKTEITTYFISKTTAKVHLDFRLSKQREIKSHKPAKERLREMIANNESVTRLIQKFDLNLE